MSPPGVVVLDNYGLAIGRRLLPRPAILASGLAVRRHGGRLLVWHDFPRDSSVGVTKLQVVTVGDIDGPHLGLMRLLAEDTACLLLGGFRSVTDSLGAAVGLGCHDADVLEHDFPLWTCGRQMHGRLWPARRRRGRRDGGGR